MTRRVAIVLALTSPACGDSSNPPSDSGTIGDASVEDGDAADLDAATDADLDGAVQTDPCILDPHAVGCPVTITSPIILGLSHAPFPNDGHADVAVHVPPRFDPDDDPGLIVFFHGFNNCVDVVIGTTNAPCTQGAPARTALSLAAQLDASGANAILVAIQLRFDQASSDVGDLVIDGELRRILDETLTELDDALRVALRTESFERIVLTSHSGGYLAVATCLVHAQIDGIREVALYDSLYGSIATFDAYVRDGIVRFQPMRADGLRFLNVYTVSGGTLDNARAMAGRIEGWAADAGTSASVLYDDTTATLDAEAFAHPILVKRSGLGHDAVVRYYFERFVRASGFRPRAAP